MEARKILDDVKRLSERKYISSGGLATVYAAV